MSNDFSNEIFGAMKRLLFSCLLAVGMVVHAQVGINIDSLMNDMPDVGDNIYISVVVSDKDQYQPEATRLLENNLNTVIGKGGFIDSEGSSPFFIATSYNLLSKDIIPGLPSRISQEVQFNFIIGDAKENKVFASYACSVRGVGTNEQKAIISAIRRIPWSDETFTNFINEGKKCITDYYNIRIPQIVEEAKLLEKQGKYEQAISCLTTVPKACRQYNNCMRMALQVYQNMIDHRAYEWLSRAKSTWASSPNKAGADRTIALMDSIPSGSKYESEVDALISDIKSRVKEIDDQEWQLKMEKIKAQNRAADRQLMATKTVKKSSHPNRRSGGGYAHSYSSSSSGSSLSNLADRWRSQPTWKKVLIAGGIGLGAAALGGGYLTAKVAGALLARTSFHIIKLF